MADGSMKNYIHQDTQAEGKFKTGGDVHVGGSFKGELESKGCVTVQQSGKVEGQVKTNTAIIQGAINGKMEAEGHIELSDSCELECDVVASTIVVQPGAKLKGSFVITPDKQEREKSGKKN